MAIKEKVASMNILDFFMLGFGSMVGVGWSVAVNGWFASGGGPLPTFLAFLVGTLIVIPIGFCYAELTPAMPVAGGTVAFAYKAFGKFPSFVAGWFIALAFITILPWEAININSVLALLFPVLKSGTPLYTVAGTGIYANGLAIGVLISLVIIYLNHVGSRVAARAQTFMAILLAATGVLVILFALSKADPANLLPIYQNIGKGSHTGFLSGFIAMFAIVPFFLAGFDTIPQGAEEGGSKINFNNLGKVMVGAILMAGSFYCLIILSTALAMPWQDFTTLKRPAISLLFIKLYGDGFLGISLYWLAMIGALCGLFTVWNGLYIGSARLLLGMSRARMIPKFFSTVHAKYGTPYGANMLCAIASLIGPFVGIGIIDPLTTAGGDGFCNWLAGGRYVCDKTSFSRA